MQHGYLTLKQKCFQLSIKLSVANVLLQRWRQHIPHTWSRDAETSVAEADVCSRPGRQERETVGFW